MANRFGNANGGGFNKETWLTPPHILAALGPFDLDPCAAPSPRPWPSAARHIELPEDGLTAEWQGRVWCNPPYGAKPFAGFSGWRNMGTVWLWFCTNRDGHVPGSGLATGPRSSVLARPHRVLFTRRQTSNERRAPSVLIAYGESNARQLAACGLEGYCMKLEPAFRKNDDLFGAAA